MKGEERRRERKKSSLSFFFSTSDVRNMLAPVRYTLASIVSTLLGTAAGIFFCLSLSYRLTMLSIAVLGPLTMLTTMYSKFASELYARVWGIQGTISDCARYERKPFNRLIFN